MTTFVANRTWVNAACEKLLNPDCQKRILFFSGESGIGKTTLLHLFLENIPPGIPRICVDFENSGLGIIEILHQCGRRLEWKNLPGLATQMDNWQRIRFASLERKSALANQGILRGSELLELRDKLNPRFSQGELLELCMRLDINYDDLAGEAKAEKLRELLKRFNRRSEIRDLLKTIKRLRPETRSVLEPYLPQKAETDNYSSQIDGELNEEFSIAKKNLQSVLTKTYFDDLRALDSPVFMIFDTYEQASTEVEQWIRGPFLEGVTRVSNLRLLLAGQVVPDAHNIEWGHCCESRELLGITDAKDWLDFMKKSGRRIDKTEPLPFLETLCGALRGHPENIRKVIEGLPTG